MTHCVHLDIRLRKWAHTHVYSGVWWSHQASVAISEMYALAFWIASPYHDNVHCDIPLVSMEPDMHTWTLGNRNNEYLS